MAFVTIFTVYYIDFHVDDAYIYLVYVKNFLEGNGLTFNGTYVEGFSSVIWVLLLSFFGLFTKDLLSLAKLLSYVFAICNIALIYVVVFRASGNRYFSMIGSLFFAINPFTSFWTAGALETHLFTFIFLLSIHILALTPADERWRILSGVMFGLLAASRPEGFAIFGIVPLFFLYERYGPRKTGYSQSRVYAGYLGVIALLLIWRYALYSDILPNTAYAKSGPILRNITGLGLDYTRLFIKANFPEITALALSINLVYAFGKWGNSYAQRLSFMSVISIVSYTVFVLVSGGDWMLGLRLFVPIFPFMAYCYAITAYFLFSLAQSWSLRIFPVAIPVICFITMFYYHLNINNFVGDMLHTEAKMPPEMIQYIRDNTSKADYISVVDAGEIPYRTNTRVIDTAGLNDKHIASLPGSFMNRFDNEYVLSFKPKVVQMHIRKTPSGAIFPYNFIGSVKMYYSKEFQSNYTYIGNGLFRRLDAPSTKHAMTDYYNAHFSVAGNRTTNGQLMVELTNAGSGVWVAGDEKGCMFLEFVVFNNNGDLISSNRTELARDLRQGDSTVMSLNLPPMDKGAYFINLGLYHKSIDQRSSMLKGTTLSFVN